MPKKKLTAHVVLDRSGSMHSIKDDTIGAFNTYVSTLAEESPDSSLSLTIFDSQSVDTVIDGKKIGKVKPLDDKTYVPRGGTPLFDAIGKTAASLAAAKGKNKALVIITDGYENASREFNRDAIRKLLDERQEKDNWLVLYLGANQDAFAEGSTFGTRSNTTLDYAASSKGIRKGMAAAASATARYAATGSLSVASFTDEERSDAKSA